MAKAIAIQQYAEGDPKRTGEHFIVDALVDQGGGLTAIVTSAGWKLLEPLNGEDGNWYVWTDGPPAEPNYRTCGRVNGQLIALNPHGNKPFVFGWCEVEV